jgi:hypothetical protein
MIGGDWLRTRLMPVAFPPAALPLFARHFHVFRRIGVHVSINAGAVVVAACPVGAVATLLARLHFSHLVGGFIQNIFVIRILGSPALVGSLEFLCA